MSTKSPRPDNPQPENDDKAHPHDGVDRSPPRHENEDAHRAEGDARLIDRREDARRTTPAGKGRSQ